MARPSATVKKAPLRLALIPLIALLGAAAAVYLSQLYYGIYAGTAGFKSLCNINEAMNCDAVATSRWAELFRGLPLSSFVAGWFVSLAIVGLLARVDTWRKESVAVGFVMSAFGSLYGIVLLVVMFGVVKTACLFCLAIDVAIFLLLGLFWSLKEGPLFADIDRSKLKSFATITAISLFVMIVVSRPSQQPGEKQSASDVAAMAQSILASAPVDMKLPENAPFLGNPDAKITIVEFSDFQCPFCKRGAYILNSVLNRYPNDVRVVFRPFPLDQSCNRIVKSAMHPHACALSRSAYCAAKAGKFKPVYEEIFENQDMLTADSAKNIPLANGVDESALQACLDSEEAKAFVSGEIEAGVALGIQSTPTFFINGRKVEGAYPLEAWDQAIQQLLAGK